MNEILDCYIGFDQREAEAWDVCRLSMARRSSKPIHAVKLDSQALSYNGWYTRRWYWEDGSRIDTRDRKPFSTDFAFTRFLVPAFQMYEGWALFCDCDFLFTADIAGLFERADPQYAVQVVKHKHIPTEQEKMDGQKQTRYHRKNWSSLILWNCSHPANKFLTTAAVNNEPGQWLHAFAWLRDEQIGELPQTWNHLVGVNDAAGGIPCGIHYTNGGPWMSGYENCEFADLWRKERDSKRALTGPLPTEFARGKGL